jgi:hypothetical protein
LPVHARRATTHGGPGLPHGPARQSNPAPMRCPGGWSRLFRHCDRTALGGLRRWTRADWYINACFVRRFIGPNWRFPRIQEDVRRRRHDGPLIGVEDDLLGPFALGSDPNRRRIDQLRLIGKECRRLRKKPVGYQKQSQERASDPDEVLGYWHWQSRQQLARLRSA